MKNKQFALLMNEVAQLVKGSSMLVREGEAVVCNYDQWSCRVENGVTMGLTDQIIILIKMDSVFSASHFIHLNGCFELTQDGYFAMPFEGEYFYVRHKPMPTHPKQVIDILSETISVVNKLKEDILILCG